MRTFAARRIYAISAMLTLLLFSGCAQPEAEQADSAIAYLEHRYGTEFEVVERIDDINANVVFSYKCRLSNNEKIVFQVSQIYTVANIFPFLPAIKHKSFSDDFGNALKKNVLASADTEEIRVNAMSDIPAVSEKIYAILSAINDELSLYNIEPTKYSCSATISIYLHDRKTPLNFDILDLANIQDTIREKL
jgi:hypothetical protein